MSTRGQSPSVDILTEGNIIFQWRTMNIMHHMFCRMTNCDKKNIGECYNDNGTLSLTLTIMLTLLTLTVTVRVTLTLLTLILGTVVNMAP